MVPESETLDLKILNPKPKTQTLNLKPFTLNLPLNRVAGMACTGLLSWHLGNGIEVSQHG